MAFFEKFCYYWHQWGVSPLVYEFRRALEDPQRAQDRALRRLLRIARDTEYGRKHGFSSISGVDAYRSRLPLINYEDIAELVERHRRGEAGVLVPGRPEMFARTSGTTGRSKYIPVTRRSYLDFHFGQTAWRHGVLADHREIVAKQLLTVVSPAADEHTSAGIPCGAITGKSYTSLSPVTRRFFPVPYEVMGLDDYHAKYYMIARMAAGADLRMIGTANATTLLVLAEEMARNAERLAHDLEHGSISVETGLPGEVLDKLWPRLAPDMKTAGRIRRVLDQGRQLTPSDLWPNIQVACVWLGGAAGFFLPRVKELYAPRAVRDIGFSASEGYFAAPLEDDTSAGAPVLSRVFMEFIPESEVDSEAPRTLLAHQLDVGERYFLVISTTGGLHRYKMNDLVEVAGRCGSRGQSPTLRFLSKGARILSLTGEKVSEAQVSTAAAVAVRESGLRLTGFTVSIRLPAEEKAGYVIAAEPAPAAGESELRPFLRAFELALCAANIEYAEKRRSMRLSPPVLLILPQGSYSRWRAERVAGGAHDGQIKPPNLLQHEEFNRSFQPTEFVTLPAENRR
jgi:GH3 auxin-responsive promoter